jgi:hypothetical protein
LEGGRVLRFSLLAPRWSSQSTSQVGVIRHHAHLSRARETASDYETIGVSACAAGGRDD